MLAFPSRVSVFRRDGQYPVHRPAMPRQCVTDVPPKRRHLRFHAGSHETHTIAVSPHLSAAELNFSAKFPQSKS
ncbi:MAG: hypothetical protein Kow0040_30550 [Thermogutta sp.]